MAFVTIVESSVAFIMNTNWKMSGQKDSAALIISLVYLQKKGFLELTATTAYLLTIITSLQDAVPALHSFLE